MVLHKKITALRYLETIKDSFERQVFVIRVNSTNLRIVRRLGYLLPRLTRLDHTDKTGLSGEAQPPGLTDAQRIGVCYSRSDILGNCHERLVAVLA